MNTSMIFNFMRTLLEQLRHNEEGQTAIEYALVLALISLVVVGAVALGLTGIGDQAVQAVTDAFAGL